MTTFTLARAVTESPTGQVPALCSSVFARPYLRMPELAALRAHDAARGSRYVPTLAAYLDLLGNVAGTAGSLGIHVNTFRYRLRRLVAIAGLDLDDADQRLVAALELATGPPDPPVAIATDPDAPQWRGLPPGVPLAVVALRLPAGTGDAPCRLARMVSLSWEAFRTSAWCDVAGFTVYSVVALGTQGSADVVASTVRRVVREAGDALGVPVVGGIGPAVGGPGEAELSRRLADEVVRIVERRGDRLASFGDVRTAVVLDAFAAAAASRPGLDGGVVARLAEHDARYNRSYVETLRAYLVAFGDATAAAARMYVHVRTFRYRLRRIEAIGGFRLDDPVARLAVALRLRIGTLSRSDECDGASRGYRLAP